MTLATEMRDAYLEAEKSLLLGKETVFNGKRLALEDLDKIRAGRVEWERRANAEVQSAAGVSTFGGLGFSVANLSGGDQ